MLGGKSFTRFVYSSLNDIDFDFIPQIPRRSTPLSNHFAYRSGAWKSSSISSSASIKSTGLSAWSSQIIGPHSNNNHWNSDQPKKKPTTTQRSRYFYHSNFMPLIMEFILLWFMGKWNVTLPITYLLNILPMYFLCSFFWWVSWNFLYRFFYTNRKGIAKCLPILFTISDSQSKCFPFTYTHRF